MACSNVLGLANINLTFSLGRLDGIYLVLVWFTALLVTISQSAAVLYRLPTSCRPQDHLVSKLVYLYCTTDHPDASFKQEWPRKARVGAVVF